jgi:hypothetical protein
MSNRYRSRSLAENLPLLLRARERARLSLTELLLIDLCGIKSERAREGKGRSRV